jgi:hypothetical protein
MHDQHFLVSRLGFMLQCARLIWVGVQFAHRALSPKVENEKSMIRKIIENNLKARSFKTDLKKFSCSKSCLTTFFP